MSAIIVDRRTTSKNRTLKNRRRYIELNKEEIRKQVKDSLKDGSITDPSNDKARNIRVRTSSEPSFRKDPKTGHAKHVIPGNKKFIPNDTIRKPESGAGGRGNEGSPDGHGEDEFMFELSRDEFMEFVFEDLELPDMVKKQLKDVVTYDMSRAGYRTTGTPAQMDLIKSASNALSRRIGLGRPSLEYLEGLKDDLARTVDPQEKERLRELIEAAEKKRTTIPWMDPIDVKYRNFTKQPKPRSKAVVFCVMDVSFSMSEELKELSKSFFMLLYLFLMRKYDAVSIRFIKHHSWATDTTEDDFFYGTETGGTVVSTAFEMVENIILNEYPIEDWNIYIAQASDGDNAYGDNEVLTESIKRLFPKTQYFAYIQTSTPDREHDKFYGYYQLPNLWTLYEDLSSVYPIINMKKVTSKKDVWTVFAELFQKGVKKDVTTSV